MNTEKPFLVFAGNTFYPGGGWDDFQENFETLDSAVNWLAKTAFEWNHIIDIRTMEKVYSNDY